MKEFPYLIYLLQNSDICFLICAQVLIFPHSRLVSWPPFENCKVFCKKWNKIAFFINEDFKDIRTQVQQSKVSAALAVFHSNFSCSKEHSLWHLH